MIEEVPDPLDVLTSAEQVAAPATSTPTRAALSFVFVTVALDMLALGIIAPVIPGLVQQFLGGDTAKTAKIIGLYGTSWALMQFVFSPVLGALSDRYGRRPVILLSNFGLGLDYLLMAMAPSLNWLLAGRVISGITAASVPTATAYIVDVTTPEKRSASFGIISAAFGIGFILGPALGGLLGSVNPRLPFWVAGCLSCLNGCYGVLVLPESLHHSKRGAFKWKRANPIGSLQVLKAHSSLLLLPELFSSATWHTRYWQALMCSTHSTASIGVIGYWGFA